MTNDVGMAAVDFKSMNQFISSHFIISSSDNVN